MEYMTKQGQLFKGLVHDEERKTEKESTLLNKRYISKQAFYLA